MDSAESPADVVQRQLDAYNARDLDRFLACFADDARGFELGCLAPTMEGKEAIRARYGALFAASPALHSRVVHRTAFGRAVIDHEHVTGRNGSPDVFEIAVVYEVEDGLIRRFHAIRAE
jgi:hypothetical protein